MDETVIGRSRIAAVIRSLMTSLYYISTLVLCAAERVVQKIHRFFGTVPFIQTD